MGEVVGKMLENLLFNRKNETLDHVYASWLDSMSYKESFQPYLAKFNLPSGFDPWAVSLSHPFKQVDEQWLKEVGENLQNKDKLADFLIKISARHDNKQAQVVGINIWGDVKALIEFDGKHISYLSSLSETIGFYVSHFYKLDSAIRRLYSLFLNNRKLIEPFQELYKEQVTILLDMWFKFFNNATLQHPRRGVLLGWARRSFECGATQNIQH